MALLHLLECVKRPQQDGSPLLAIAEGPYIDTASRLSHPSVPSDWRARSQLLHIVEWHRELV
eukprot:6488808-Amphidinium_carterae.5